ncbi:MAG: hypothetical protein CVT67_03815 [Actinobacteria bacterium HGW-Actinobacteria-7]|jgi:menaquinone-dependent protoporphyrinogen oxidase|nr:MAG: hypothetical protein CVT67_03815 [Actinobacteria bacterium HGW-Actinobacteria-7]
MSKFMVVYGTKSGCTRGVAQRIGECLARKGADVDVVSAQEADGLAAYDAVIVGSGIRMSQWHEPARAWVAQNAEQLQQIPVAFYTVNLTMAKEPERAPEVRAWTDPVIESSGVSPLDIGLFAGWNEPKEFSFIERTVLKALKAPQGDFRDWDAIDAWAETVSEKMGV